MPTWPEHAAELPELIIFPNNAHDLDIHQKKNTEFDFGFLGDKGERISITSDKGLILKGRGRGRIAERPFTHAPKDRIFPNDKPYMLIGYFKWGKTDKDPDTIKVYRVFYAPEFGPIVVLKRPILETQQTMNQRYLKSFFFVSTGTDIDEIRIGKSVYSVLMGTKPVKK